jgi:dipeptidyl-peptidase 4
MPKFRPTLILILLSMQPARPADPASAQKGNPLDSSFLRLYAETHGFMLGRPVSPKPTPDGKAVLFLRAEPKVPKLKLYEFDVAAGQTKELLSPETVLKGAEEKLTPEEKARRERMRVSVGGFTSFQLSEDGKLILLSLSGKLYVVTRADGSVRELETGPGTILDAKFSPDGSMVAYVRDHDVHAYDLAKGKAFAVTKGGTEKKTHGLAEFVAQEEMGRYSGYWWSPDSKFIAFEEADYEGVEQWFVADPAKPDQPPLPQFYPRPGKKNVAVRIGVVPIAGGQPQWLDWDRKKYEYVARVHWKKERLAVLLQTREQGGVEMHGYTIDAQGNVTWGGIVGIDWDMGWLDLAECGFVVTDAGQVLFFVPMDPWSDETKVTGMGACILAVNRMRALPKGSANGTDVVGRMNQFSSFDAKRNEVWGLAADNPTEAHLVRIDLNKKPGEQTVLTKGPGMHSAAFAEQQHGVFALTSTSLEQMPKTYAYTSGGGKLGELPSVAIEPDFKPNITIQKVGNEPGYYTAVVRPRNFEPGQKYPVIVDVYGGPKHQTVIQAMRPWLLMQWLADQGFIVVGIDNRGTPGRGKEWEWAIYQNFGSVPLEDQVKGLKLLGERFPEMDLDRVGIVGWSFGGYMSALAVLKRPDIFKAAVAGAPVTDWEDYDTHYTERYLGLLPAAKAAYEQASLLPLAPKLERPLLLVHGTADDNVYFRHTLRLTDALFRAGREFEVLPLPSLTHMVPDPIVTERLWTRIAGHFKKHLGEAKER